MTTQNRNFYSSFAGKIAHFWGSFNSSTFRIAWMVTFFLPLTVLIINGARIQYYTSKQPFVVSANPPVPFKPDSMNHAVNYYHDNTKSYNVFPYGKLEAVMIVASAEGRHMKYVLRSSDSVLIIFISLWLVLSFAVRVISNSRNLLTSVDISNTERIEAKKLAFDSYVVFSNDQFSTLREDIINSRQIASDVSFRSVLLLVSGIVMAMMGIGIFYITLPEQKVASGDYAAIIHGALRPIAMLIFVEALAWFLLKQYSEIFRQYTLLLTDANRKTNLLASLQTIGENSTPQERLFILENLMQPPTTTILKNGETTEQLEMHKITNKNPVLETLNEFIAFKNQKNEKSNKE